LDARELALATAATRIHQPTFNPLLHSRPPLCPGDDDDDVLFLKSVAASSTTLDPAVQKMVEERTRAALEAKRMQRVLSPGAHSTTGPASDDHVDPDFGMDITVTVEWRLDPVEEARMPPAARRHRTVRRVFKHGIVGVQGVVAARCRPAVSHLPDVLFPETTV
jgi:hypothetical protein